MSPSGSLTFAGVVVVTVLLLAPKLDSRDSGQAGAGNGADTLSPRMVAAMSPVGNGFATRELVRSADGHFYADAQVNGAQVRFLIDTGASFVALTAADAQRAGIAPRTERIAAVGAGGEIEVMPVTIDRVALGPLVASNVGGAVVDELQVSLLGQSFLARIGSVRIEGNRMILR